MTHTLTPYDGDCSSIPDWRVLVDRFYTPDSEARSILIEHSKAVSDFALAINRQKSLGLAPEEIEFAAMLHDIGIVGTKAPGIGCYGDKPYIMHGVIGADMLRGCGAPEWSARVAERHTGSGLTVDDIKRQSLPLPLDRSLVPQTMLEKLICYADKFFSKRPGQLHTPKNISQVIKEMSGHGTESLDRFMDLHKVFGD